MVWSSKLLLGAIVPVDAVGVAISTIQVCAPVPLACYDRLSLTLPDDVAGQFALKSSVARSGIEHLMAGYIDPGFNNSVLTLELKNARRSHPVFLWPGMRIGQIIWQRMAATPTTSYRESGRYNGDKSVTASKGLL